MATLNLADLYGTPSGAGMSAGVGVTQVSGPNQGSVATQATPANQDAGRGAAFTWIGFMLVLALLRVLIELGGRVQ